MILIELNENVKIIRDGEMLLVIMELLIQVIIHIK